jgi:GntR family transcriptional regulator/MocR family aminotransferase
MAKSVSSLDLPLRSKPEAATLTHWLYEELRAAILEGRLKRGIRLPSTRDFAHQHGVSRGTAMLVMEQLRDEGYLTSRTGAGTWVSERLPDDLLSSSHPPSRTRAAVAAHTAVPAWPQPIRPFQASDPAVDLFPAHTWSRLTSRLWKHSSRAMLVSGDRAGYVPLRCAIANYLSTARGVQCSPQQVIVVTGTQQALDIATRLLLRKGDAAWIEDPGYFGAVWALRRAGAKIVPVPVDEDGIDVQRGRQAAPRAKLAYVTPAHQFPLGSTMSLDRRLALLRWAASVGSVVIEDDYDSEFRFSGKPIPALQGLDKNGCVLFIGSFNKVLFPGLRLGYMVVPERLMDQTLQLRFEADFWVNSINQAVLSDFISEGHLGRHIRRMREVYAERLAALHDAAATHLGDQLLVSDVQAGLATTGFFKAPVTSFAMEELAASHGVTAHALERFTLRKQAIRGLLLGFAGFTPEEIAQGMQKLARTIEKIPRT